MEIFLTLWLLSGAIGFWRTYHGLLKHWYDMFGYSYWDYDEGGMSALKLMCFLSPILIIGGMLSLLLLEISYVAKPVWWFTTKNKEKRNGEYN